MFIYEQFAYIIECFSRVLLLFARQDGGFPPDLGIKDCSGQEMRQGISCSSSNRNEPRIAADGSSISAALWTTPISRQAT